jgi:DNA-binding phage protein
MPELEKLRQLLSDRNIQAVARGAGVHPNALYRLMSGATSPKYETVQRVMAYLTRQEAAHNG